MKKSSYVKRLCIFLTFMLAIAPALAGIITYKCTVNKKDAVFKQGEKIILTARMLEDGKTVSRPLHLRYILYHDHKVVKNGLIKADRDIALETSLDRPGWVFLQLFAVEEYKDGNVIKKRQVTQTIIKNGKKRTVKASGGIGAMVSPEQITPSMKEPDDFDGFWNNAKKELAAVPVKLLESKPIPQNVITKAKIKNPEKYVFSDIKIQCAGGMPVSGYLTIPKNAKKSSLPAIVTYHGAGVRSANLHAGDIANDIIVLDVNAHGIENGKPEEFYTDLRKNHYYTTLDVKRQKNYLRWNRDDRNKYYMRGMFLRVLRALEYVKSHASQLGIPAFVFEKWNIHLHVPEGAIPKDGPSAGITMATAIASAFTQRRVRSNLAMSGEITLRGKVLPVGGIKEKILAAKRAGIKEIILCAENRRDIEVIPEEYVKGLEFHYVEDISEVLDIALLETKVNNPLNLTESEI